MHRASVHLPLSTSDFGHNVHIWMRYNSRNMKDMKTREDSISSGDPTQSSGKKSGNLAHIFFYSIQSKGHSYFEGCIV